MPVANQELLDLQWERRNCRRKKSSYESEQAINKTKIDRLEIAKTQITSLKSDAEDLCDGFKSTSSVFASETSWIGRKKDDISTCMDSSVCKDYSTYVIKVDEVLDAICDEITRLENENWEKKIIIGRLASRINSLANSIEKHFN